MSIQTLEKLSQETQTAARNTVQQTAARLNRENSVTAWANRLLAAGAKKQPSSRKTREEGVYILSSEDVGKGCRMEGGSTVAPDGYVRRSPVQSLVVDPGYYRKQVRRGILWTVAAAFVAAALYILTRFGITRF